MCNYCHGSLTSFYYSNIKSFIALVRTLPYRCNLHCDADQPRTNNKALITTNNATPCNVLPTNIMLPSLFRYYLLFPFLCLIISMFSLVISFLVTGNMAICSSGWVGRNLQWYLFRTIATTYCGGRTGRHFWWRICWTTPAVPTRTFSALLSLTTITWVASLAPTILAAETP